MGLTDILAITPVPVISGLILFVLAVAILYLARPSAHKLIYIVTRALHDAMSSASESANRGEERLAREPARLGFPPPGHEYWTEETLAGAAARFPEMDLTPYR